jgi:para-aminobenzoate synthetase
VKNDQISLEQIAKYVKIGHIHNIVISPGPGTPLNSRDVGICPKVLQTFPNVPIFGVCLGFQSLCLVHGGGQVVQAPEPIHGRLSTVVHSGNELFNGIPSGFDFDVVRYLE